MASLKGLLSGRRRRGGERFPVPFVVGAARSGNTLLRLMLDAHPELAIPPETDFIPEAAAADTPDAFMDVLTGRWGWRLRDLQIELGTVGDAVRQLAPFDAGAAVRVAS